LLEAILSLFLDFLINIVNMLVVARGDQIPESKPKHANELLEVVVANESVAFGTDKGWGRLRVGDSAINVLSHVAEAELAPPAISLDIVEAEVGARIGLVAANDTRW